MKNCTGIFCPMQYGKVDPATCQAADSCSHATPPKTKADRIRSMTDEELAEFLLNRDLNVVEKASKAAGFTYKVDRESCLVDVIDWLKQETKDG